MANSMQDSWRTLNASVRGAVHRRSGLPNQDAIRIVRRSGEFIIMAVADGHGSSKSFRSQTGALLAVKVALKVCHQMSMLESNSQRKRWADERMPTELVRQWRQRVDGLLTRMPFSARELENLDQVGRHQVEALPYLAYGSTVMAVVVAPTFILYMQLGDGDILIVTPDGQVARPLEKDDRLIANETTSLCSDTAWTDVRLRFQGLAGGPPALILASTDGYANSFRDDASFRQVARDLWVMIRDGDEEIVEQNLAIWLNEASSQGSGDDVTAGLLWRDSQQF